MMYALIPLATLLYIVLDIYAVIGSLPAMLRSVSFWLLALLFTVLNGVAFTLFQANARNAFGAEKIGSLSTSLLILFFSTIGTFSIIQSFSLKFADYKAIDLEQMFEKLRATVLSEAALEKAGLANDRKLKLITRLVAYYHDNPTLIDQDYDALMGFGPRSQEQINKEIALAAASPRGKIPALVKTMVLTDEPGAWNYLRSPGRSPLS